MKLQVIAAAIVTAFSCSAHSEEVSTDDFIQTEASLSLPAQAKRIKLDFKDKGYFDLRMITAHCKMRKGNSILSLKMQTQMTPVTIPIPLREIARFIEGGETVIILQSLERVVVRYPRPQNLEFAVLDFVADRPSEASGNCDLAIFGRLGGTPPVPPAQ